jgi:hypothetical protein
VPTQYTTLNLYGCSFIDHHASWPLSSWAFMSHFSATWSVTMKNFELWR